MDGFKNSTKTKYMCGGPVKKGNGGGVTAKKTAPKAAQPVQKKSLGGILKAMSPAAALIGSDVGKDLMKSGVFGVGGLLASQLMKKKQSGQPLTPAEDKQLAQSAQTPMKKGGMAKKGVPVASKRPMVGLAAMPKKK